jgi:CTP synthase (UTP-ammonia lyase)
MKLEARPSDMKPWLDLVHRMHHPAGEARIAVVGKYVQLEDAYKSLREALLHGGLAHNHKTVLEWIEAEDIDSAETAAARLHGYDGILVPGGFGKRGIQGMVHTIQYARVHRVPFFGICLGMQCATIEYARDVAGMKQADSTEFDPQTPHRVIYKLRELLGVDEMGGTMRLGAWSCKLEPGSFAHKAYGKLEISERHRHRYEFNRDYEKTLVAAGCASPAARRMKITSKLSRRRATRGSSAASSTRNSNQSRWSRTRSLRRSSARRWSTRKIKRVSCRSPSAPRPLGSRRTSLPKSLQTRRWLRSLSSLQAFPHLV